MKDERRIRDAIRSTRDVRAEPAFRERLKREFESGTISEPVVPPRESRARAVPIWAWVLVPTAAVIAIVALLLPRPEPGWTVQAVRGDGLLEIDGRTLSTDDTDLIAQALATGREVRLPEGVSLDLRLGDRLILELAGGSDATLPDPSTRDFGGILISELRDGELRIKTGPGFPGTIMRILTTEGRTEIVGTIVSVYKGDGYTCVCVIEGTPLVGVDETDLEEVTPGKLKVMFEGGRAPILTDISPQHEADLVEFGKRYEGLFEGPK